jgi:hypothetical protein
MATMLLGIGAGLPLFAEAIRTESSALAGTNANNLPGAGAIILDHNCGGVYTTCALAGQTYPSEWLSFGLGSSGSWTQLGPAVIPFAGLANVNDGFLAAQSGGHAVFSGFRYVTANYREAFNSDAAGPRLPQHGPGCSLIERRSNDPHPGSQFRRVGAGPVVLANVRDRVDQA